MTKPIITIVVLLALIGGGFYLTKKQPTKVKEVAMVQPTENAINKDTAVMEKKESGVMLDKNTGYTGTVLAGQTAPLLDFTKADYDTALKTNKLIVLYFYANWCPICIAEFPVMQSAFNAQTTNNLIGFRVNYNDNQTDNDEKNVAREFGVAYQHTKVFVKGGQRILKSPEGWDEKRYISEMNNALGK